jgi:quercetin dioxygenase-like cupin family protein
VYEVHHPWTGGGIHHPGEEFVYCLRGEVCAMVGEEKHLLGPGDSISFDSSLVHNFERVTPPPAPAPQVLSVWIDGAPARAPDATPIRSSST